MIIKKKREWLWRVEYPRVQRKDRKNLFLKMKRYKKQLKTFKRETLINIILKINLTIKTLIYEIIYIELLNLHNINFNYFPVTLLPSINPHFPLLSNIMLHFSLAYFVPLVFWHFVRKSIFSLFSMTLDWTTHNSLWPSKFWCAFGGTH